MTGPKWTLNKDRNTVTLEFPTDPPTALELDAGSVESLLQGLGSLRAQMQPDIPNDYSMGQTVPAIPDPRWVTEPDAMMGNTLLHIRDPRYGWLHYLLPREEARKLAQYLQSQVETPPPGLGSDKPN